MNLPIGLTLTRIVAVPLLILFLISSSRVHALIAAAIFTAAAQEAATLARPYGKEVGRLARDSSWARHLASRGRAADVAACLTLDTPTVVPIYRADVDNLVVAHG